jgi:hypothetical protein
MNIPVRRRNAAGRLHCNDVDPETGLTLPAQIWANGIKSWYIDGRLHRADIDPKTKLTLPAAIWDSGAYYYINGKAHRTDIDLETGLTLPARILPNGIGYWHVDDKRHRTDGPAAREPYRVSYWWEGEKVTRKAIIKRVTVVPWVLWTNRGATRRRRMPGAVLDEVVEFAMLQMAAP